MKLHGKDTGHNCQYSKKVLVSGQPQNPMKLPVPQNQDMLTVEPLVEFARKSTTVLRS